MGSGQAKPLSSEQKQQNERRWREWVRGELAAGVTPLALTAQLVKRGWPRERATLLISSNQDAARPPRAAEVPPLSATPGIPPETPNPYARQMIAGASVFLVGVAVTVTTAVLSGAHGGPVVIAWGAIVLGALQFFGAAMANARHRRR